MPREIVLGNGSLNVALDKKMQIRDFFYPLVGLENHAGHFFRFGVAVDGVFSWVNDNWEISTQYMPETLVSRYIAVNSELEIELEVNDAVYSFLDIYLRKIAIKNLSDRKREAKVFMSQDFHIYGEDTGDTAMYESVLQALIHYKRKRYFLINGENAKGDGIFEYSAGIKEAFGKEGAWKDAEDGILEMNPIAQGSVDSAVSFQVKIDAKSVGFVYYWIACGTSLDKVKELNTLIKKTGVEQMLLETENYCSAWVNKRDLNLSILPKEIIRLFKTSLLIMRTHVDNGGSIIASCDSDILQFHKDTYSYMWPRDASICAMAFDKAGFQEVSRLYFGFCNRVVSDEGYFRHKYWADGSLGSTWHALIDAQGKAQLPIQLDETGLVVFALWKHFQKYHDLEFISQVYPRLVLQPANFIKSYRDEVTGLPKASFDMWEEKTGIYTSSVACAYAALSSAAKFARVFYDSKRQEQLNQAALEIKQAMRIHLFENEIKRFIKAIQPNGSRDTSIDSSLAFTFLMETFDANSPEVTQTMNAILDQLWVNSGIGGLARYKGDQYHRVSNEVQGNPWFICTLWLARWYIRIANSMQELKKGLDILHWVVRYALPSGVLAEQLNPYNANPLSVSPLIWSHAEFVIAVCEYIEKYQLIASAEST